MEIKKFSFFLFTAIFVICCGNPNYNGIAVGKLRVQLKGGTEAEKAEAIRQIEIAREVWIEHTEREPRRHVVEVYWSGPLPPPCANGNGCYLQNRDDNDFLLLEGNKDPRTIRLLYLPDRLAGLMIHEIGHDEPGLRNDIAHIDSRWRLIDGVISKDAQRRADETKLETLTINSSTLVR